MTTCFVCLEKISNAEYFSPPCCKKTFHKECYSKWRSISKGKCIMSKTIYTKINGELFESGTKSMIEEKVEEDIQEVEEEKPKFEGLEDWEESDSSDEWEE